MGPFPFSLLFLEAIMHRMSVVAAATLGVAVMSAVQAAQFFFEGENRAVTFQTVTDQPEANWGSAMSGGFYSISNGAPLAGYGLYNIPAGSILPGTYYFAERGYEHYAHPRGLGIDYKAAIDGDIFTGFTNFAYTYNPNNTSTDMGWMWAYTDFAGSTIASITIAPNTDYSIRVSSVAGSPSNFDVFALLSEQVLPSNTVPAGGSYVSSPVPEPASLAALGIAGLAILRQRRTR
jgi:hypothetical protein